MRQIFRWTVRLVAVIVIALCGFVAYAYIATERHMTREYRVSVPAVTIPTDAAAIARGRYLADGVSMCSDCHAADLGGKIVEEGAMMGRLVAPNLTRGKGGLGSRYKDEDYVRTLMHGVRSDNRSVVLMPSADYHFTQTDLQAVIAYVKSVPPVDRELPATSVGPLPRLLALLAGFPLSPANRIDHDRVAFAAEASADDPVAYGAHLVATAGCRGCHAPDFSGGGGPPPGGANITPVGIGEWTAQDFVTALRDHKRPNGTKIDEAMPRAYGQMSDADLASVFAFLKTLPPAGTKTASQQ